MAEAWPVGVPSEALASTFQLLRPFKPPHRTEMEDGAQRGRRSSTKEVARIAFSIKAMTTGEFQTFARFVRDDLVDGTLDFTMDVWTGASFETRNCRFAEDYHAAPSGFGFMRVSVVLDVDDYIGAAA